MNILYVSLNHFFSLRYALRLFIPLVNMEMKQMFDPVFVYYESNQYSLQLDSWLVHYLEHHQKLIQCWYLVLKSTMASRNNIDLFMKRYNMSNQIIKISYTAYLLWLKNLGYVTFASFQYHVVVVSCLSLRYVEVVGRCKIYRMIHIVICK